MSIWQAYFGGNTLGAAPLGVPSSGAGAGSPGAGPNGINEGQLQPNSRAANMIAGVPYEFLPAYPPFVRIANSRDIVYFPRFRTMTYHGNGTAANTTVTNQFVFSLPTIIIARTAAAIDASGANLPIGRSSLDTFRAQMFRAGSQQDLIDAGGGGNQNPSTTVLGSSIFGTAAQPALIPGNGLFVDTAGFLNLTVTNLIANIEVHVTLWCLEEYGPARG